MHKRLGRWKTKMLSIPGRLILTKSTLSSIFSHVMQLIKLPRKISKIINQIERNFVWGSTADKKKIQMLSWDKISKTNEKGGWVSKQVKLEIKLLMLA